MESIILLILFTYPGAFVEFTYYFLAKDRPFYHKPEGYFQTARIFFFSAVITLGSLWLFGEIHHGPLNLSTAVMFLSRENNAIVFAIFSCLASVALGSVWFGFRCLGEKIQNKWKITHKKAPNGKRKQVWMSMMADPGTPQTQYVIEIRKRGEMIKCGLAYHVPDDLREDTGFALMHCDLVKQYIDDPEYDIISEPLVSYIDIKTDAEIIIRDASAFSKWLAGEDKDKGKE